MRESFFESDFIIEDGVFKGITLGYDYCAEHENGFEDIKNFLDIKLGNSEFLGIEGRRIRNAHKGVKFFKIKYKNKIYYNLIFNPYGYTFYDNRPVSEKFYKNFATAWNSSSFGISLKGSKNEKIKYLEEIYDAILKKNAIFCFVNKNEKNPFSRSYPFLGIADRVSTEFAKDMYDYDYDLLKLKESSESTGIYEYLDKFKKIYRSLKPCWSSYMDKTVEGRILKTDYPVIYFLDSGAQKKYKNGWYTVEELKMWAHDVGPVMVELQSPSKEYIFKE